MIEHRRRRSRRVYGWINRWLERWLAWAPWCGRFHVEREPISVQPAPWIHHQALRAWAHR